MGEEEHNEAHQVSLEEIDLDSLREIRRQKERDYLLSDEGFLDFVRQSGAAPDAEYQPHGRYAPELIEWNGDPDPDNPEVVNYNSKLTLWPRGSFKSHVFTIGQATHRIAKDPNIRLIVCSETNRQAKKFVQEVMRIVESEWFCDLFGRHKGKDWKWGAGTFTSALRTKEGIKDPTIACAGVGEVQTGAHWDFIIMDDVCSQENTRTSDSIENLWYWFGEMQSQLDPGGKLFMVGTLHHYSDIYCRIMREPEISKSFDISCHSWVFPIQNPNDELAPDAELFFPTRLTRRFVADRKAKQPPRLFSCFYENRPAGDDQQIFKPEYFRVIPDANVPSAVWTYIFTDFAFVADEKKKGRPDRTVFWVVSLDANRVAYVRDFHVGQWKPSESVGRLCNLWDTYRHLNLKRITVEKTTHKELISSLAEEIRRETFIKPRFVEIEGRSQESKDQRIEAAEPRWRNNGIYFVQSLRSDWRKWKPMFSEMTEWPLTNWDDIPDAISDVDKRDKDGKYYCPGPPPGWYPAAIRPVKFETINGGWNPDYGFDPREVTKRKQQGQEIWQSKAQGENLFGRKTSETGDIFRKRMPRPPQ